MSAAKLPPTRILVGTHAPNIGAGPTWTAFGDPDDHLRLTVLIAAHVSAHDAAPEVRNAAEACMAPAVAWATRLDAFDYLLEKWAPPPEAPWASLFDVDALDPGPVRAETLWDDRSFFRQRRQFLDTMLAAVSRGGWLLVRPRPSPALSLELGQIAESDEPDAPPPASASPQLEALLDLLSPECRPLLEWLVTSDILRLRDVERLLDAGGPDGFEEDLLDVVYDALPPSSQASAKCLSCVRRAQPMNGMLGPFHLVPASAEADAVGELAHWLPKQAVQVLRGCGVLQPMDGAAVRMPRAVRDQLRALAERSMPDEITSLHRTWGGAPLDPLPLEAQLETHFHAVQGGKLEDALRTARHYATDIRALAFRWSHEERYQDAAEVYRAIVKDYDKEDSYAWEYLGYNLALACGDDEPTAARAEEILVAYRAAFELDRKNPLYHGRLLGFRAFLGEDVEMEFHRGMKRYLTDYGERTEALSYFAEPVLRGMQRGRWGKHRFSVVARWRPVLRRFQRLLPLLGHDGA